MNAFPIGRRALATVLAVAALAAVPATAAAAPADRGDHGAIAQCRYVSVALPGWSGAMRLNRLTVQPPKLFSVGEPGQVGWRLLVQRTYNGNTWKRIFASVIQKGAATPTEVAPLSPLSAHINSPLFLSDGQGGYRSANYRAVLRFFWYGAGGSVVRSERHRAPFYDVLRDGSFLWTDPGDCAHGVIFP